MYNDLAYNLEGTQLAVGCRSGEVRPRLLQVLLLDVESNEKRKLSVNARHGNRVQAISWTDKGLYSIGWDNVVYLWDLRTDKPALSFFCPCPNREAFHVGESEIIVGLVQTYNNLQVYDRKTGSKVSVSTLQSNQASLSLRPTDLDCEVQLLKECRFQNDLFYAATSHNNTLQLLRLERSAMRLSPVYSFEALDTPVLSAESSLIKRRLFFSSKGSQTTIDISL